MLLIPIPMLLAAALAAGAPAPGAGPTLPTVAVEDTMHTEVPEILVRAPRVTLEEILDRVARGEARRDSMMRDQAFTLTLRLTRDPAGARPPELLREHVERVYKKRPDKVRSVTLRDWSPRPKQRADMSIDVRPRMDEEIVNFAFRPEARRDFRYRIVGRDLLGNRLVYRIAFQPRSSLDPTLPSGLVWVDTNDFVIVRQEVSFDRSPVPLFLKSVDRMVIERQRVDGYWVLKRVVLRAATSLPIPVLGSSFDLALRLDEYRVNAGLDDSIFVAHGGGR
ncbi:MAG TPA: hypothetical protein VGK89_01980 [Candidatus Eisenbacteria bacterium]|jgi:hypothetical protein